MKTKNIYDLVHLSKGKKKSLFTKSSICDLSNHDYIIQKAKNSDKPTVLFTTETLFRNYFIITKFDEIPRTIEI